MASLRTLLGLLGSLVYPQKLWNGSEQSSSCTSTRLLCTSGWQMTPFPIPNYIWPYFLTKHIRGSLTKLNDPLKPSNYKLYKDNSIIKCQQFRNASDLNINAPLYQIPRENLKFKDWISSPSQSSKKLISIIKFSCFCKLQFTEIRLILSCPLLCLDSQPEDGCVKWGFLQRLRPGLSLTVEFLQSLRSFINPMPSHNDLTFKKPVCLIKPTGYHSGSSMYPHTTDRGCLLFCCFFNCLLVWLPAS